MEWWQYVLLYLAIWVLGFFTGMQAGLGLAIAKIARPTPGPTMTPGPNDMAQMMAMMGQGRGGPQ